MKSPRHQRVGRRAFLKQASEATAAGMLLGGAIRTAAAEVPATGAVTVPTCVLGKTGVKLPRLGYGGAALPRKWGNPLSTEDRVKLVRHAYDRGIRYFDTAISYTYEDSQTIIGKALRGVRAEAFITTKVDFWNLSRPDGRIHKVDRKEVARQVDMNLSELQSDHIDAILIHGTPGVEQMTVEQCLEVREELGRARDQGKVRFIGFSAHHYFDKALALISSGEFDLCMLAYGYLPRGHSRFYSPRTAELRNACLAKAHELNMGIVAMKVLGAGMLGAWSEAIVPGYDRDRLRQLPGAAIRHILQDERVHLLTIGMRLPEEIDANVRHLAGDHSYTPEDRALLAGYTAQAYDSAAIKNMKVE
jgi:predicted aldo/keto reductase-like oxidoreductase